MMLNRIIRTFLRPLVVLAAILFCAGAATAVTPNQHFGIRPQAEGVGYFEYSITPGEKVQDALVASNLSDTPLSLVIWVAPGSTMAAGGITFGEERSGPAQWVTLPDAASIDLLPKTNQTVPFEVVVPLDTPPGEYVVGFLAARAVMPADPLLPSVDPAEGDSGFEVIVVSRVAVAMIITVPEANNCAAAITALSSASHNGRWQVGIGMENLGNQHFRGNGHFLAWPIAASEPLTQSLFSVGYFIAGDTITYPLSLETYPAPGLYNVKVNMRTDCGFETTYTQTVSVDLYAISARALPVAGGVVAGSGSYYRDASVTMSATASIGYSFVNWTEGDAVVSVQPRYPFTVTASRALVANFRSVVEPQARIELVKTVGMVADHCAITSTITVLPAEKVYYCYSITNRGNVTLTTHDLLDDQVGILFTDTRIVLAPGQAVSTTQLGRTIGAEIIVPTTNIAIWTARSDEQGLVAAASATATVKLGKAELVIRALDTLIPPSNGAETMGGQMSYTVTVRNSGTAMLKNIRVTFTIPMGTRFLSGPEPLPGSALATLPMWDCLNHAPAGSVCTVRIALLSPGHEVPVSALLQLLDQESARSLTVQFFVSADGTRLVAGPTASITVRGPQGTDESFALYIPLTLQAGALLPPATGADAALPPR